MLRLLLTLFLLGSLACGDASDPVVTGPESQGGDDVSVLTFNIRYGLADDGPNSWPLRRELVFETIRRGTYDVVGLQEALPFQIEEILAALPEYAATWRTREADPEQGEACAVLYRTERFRLRKEDSGTLWLSETPEVPGSKSWDSSLPRVATWAALEDVATTARMTVVNTHFDHRGAEARRRSAEIVHEQAARLAQQAPVVVMGDFNAGEDSPPMEVLTRRDGALNLVDSFRRLHPDATGVGTFNSWSGETDGPKIDGVLVEERVEVRSAEIVRYAVDGRYPSDHFPVGAVVALEATDAERP